jgi:hypothetical protein
VFRVFRDDNRRILIEARAPSQYHFFAAFSTEVVACLKLPAGSYTMGITAGFATTVDVDDDGWRLFCGANPRSFFAAKVAEFFHSGASYPSDAEMLLGNTNEFTVVAPGDLRATVGRALEYFDGPGGVTETKTEFGTTTDFGIDDINGEPAHVMKVPGDFGDRRIGYKMYHGIAPNGGGLLVNQYTLIMDIYVVDNGDAAALLQISSLDNSDPEMEALGGPSAAGIPVPPVVSAPVISVSLVSGGVLLFLAWFSGRIHAGSHQHPHKPQLANRQWSRWDFGETELRGNRAILSLAEAVGPV